MKVIDTCQTTCYSQLIPAIVALCHASAHEALEIVMDDRDAFADLKNYLAQQGIGFREIYHDNRLALQFTLQTAI